MYTRKKANDTKHKAVANATNLKKYRQIIPAIKDNRHLAQAQRLNQTRINKHQAEKKQMEPVQRVLNNRNIIAMVLMKMNPKEILKKARINKQFKSIIYSQAFMRAYMIQELDGEPRYKGKERLSLRFSINNDSPTIFYRTMHDIFLMRNVG